MLVLGCALGGGVVGALLPQWITRLPEPDLPPGELKPRYAQLGASRALALALALVTALAFAALTWRLGLSAALPAVLYLTAVGVLLCYIDLRVRLLPNAVVLPSYLVVLTALLGGTLISGEWEAFGSALLSGAGLWLLFGITAFVYPPGVGFGDVKLVGLLGLGLGWFGVVYAVVGLILAFIVGGVVSLVMIVTRRATRKSHLPFGPFLVTGYLLALLFAEQLARWYLPG